MSQTLTATQTFKAIVDTARPLDDRTSGNRGKIVIQDSKRGELPTDLQFRAATTSDDAAPKLPGTSVSQLLVFERGRLIHEFPTNGHNVAPPTQEIVEALAATPELKQ